MINWKNIFIEFNNTKYKLVFTNHALERMEQRWINLELVKHSIENYDEYFESYWKKVVEKSLNFNTIRTVFDINQNNIILITSMFLLWK